MTIRPGLFALCLLGLLPAVARAEIIQSVDGLPGMGTCPNGALSWFDDPVEGRVIRVSVAENTAGNSERCEFVAGGGGRLSVGQTVYIGWRSRLDGPMTGSWNGIFQLKCHGQHVADQPLVIDTRNDRLTLNNHEDINGQETPRLVWSAPLPRNRWFSIVLKVHYSESRTEGYVQVWFDGVLQTLANGTTIHHGQTWDGSENNMHWGWYRADEVNGPAFHDIKRPRIATTFAEAAPAGESTPVDGGAMDGPPPDAPGDAAIDLGVDGAMADAGETGGGARGAGGSGGGTSAGGSGASGGSGGASGSGGSGGVSGAGSGGSRGGRGGSSGGSGMTPGGATPQAGGCSCRVGDRGQAPSLASLVLLGVFGGLAWRRRRQRVSAICSTIAGHANRPAAPAGAGSRRL
jgi:MYXO-CTERM domain-containing protein